MMSLLEKHVYKILIKTPYKFVQEKQFKDFRNGLMRFDFFIPSLGVCLEVNGNQHYEFNKKFHKSYSDFTKAKERDRMKASYCLAHDLKLYCIPYWEIDNIITFEDLIQDKFLARSKFHNDEAYRQQKLKEKH